MIEIKGINYLTIDEAGEYLGRSRHTMYRLNQSGELQYYRWRRKVLYLKTDLDDYKNNVGANAPVPYRGAKPLCVASVELADEDPELAEYEATPEDFPA